MTKLGKSLLILVIIIILVIILFVLQKKISIIDSSPILEENSNPEIMEILGNKDDLVSFSVLPNSKVSGIISYNGTIKGGYFFEANILINILDINKNVLKSSNTMATTDWMTADPIDFEGSIDFTNLKKGPAYFEIHNDNASGLPENDKSVLIPIIIE